MEGNVCAMCSSHACLAFLSSGHRWLPSTLFTVAPLDVNLRHPWFEEAGGLAMHPTQLVFRLFSMAKQVHSKQRAPLLHAQTCHPTTHLHHGRSNSAILGPPEERQRKVHRRFTSVRKLVLVKHGKVRAHEGVVDGPQSRGEDQLVDVPASALVLDEYREEIGTMSARRQR